MNEISKQELKLLRKQILEKDFSRMNQKQKDAVFCVDGPLLILAGAGSGKTTVIVNRIANIIQNGNAYHSDWISPQLDEQDLADCRAYLEKGTPLSESVRFRLSDRACEPWRILAITFTNKAAGELKERLSRMLGDDGNEVWASTFHSTCARILRRDGERLGYTNHFTIYDTDDSRRLMKQCLRELDIQEKILPPKSALAEISRSKDTLTTPDEFLAHTGGDYRLELIGKAYKLYQTRLKDADAMDFDDLIANTVSLFVSCPDVLEHYQNRFRYIMVDEYQDTNHAQYLFVSLLAQKSQNLCVVGDDDQSIYKFRGATIKNIMSFEETFPDAKVIRLEQNYRSTQNILNAANAVIANNTQRKGKTLWTGNPEGKKIECHTAYSEQDEADYISKIITDKVASGRKFSDFAILYRMNSQSNALERYFIKSGIPYRIIGGTRFYERMEIRDMIAYLNVINNPADEVRLTRIINKPKRSIGDRTVGIAAQIASELGIPLFEVITRAEEFEALKRSAAKLTAFASMMRQLITAAQDPEVSMEELYHLMLEKTDYLTYLKTECEDADDRIDNINELASNIVKYEEEMEEPTLSGFLEEISLMTDIDNFDASADSVVMMTMHSAKGLEFPVVFLPGLEENIFPGMQAIYNPPEIEEERRLAYVAITRAREELYLLNAERRMIFGSTSRNRPSRFIEEIPETLVHFSKAREWKKPSEGTVFATRSAYEQRVASISAARSFGPVGGSETGSYAPGDRVSHKVFGEGMVLSITPMGNDSLLEISFDRVGTKKLMSNFAKLKKLS